MDVALLELGRLNLEIRAVQPQHARRAIDAHGDAHLAAEARLARIDGERDGVLERRRDIAQPERGRLARRGVARMGERRDQERDAVPGDSHRGPAY